MGGIQAPSRLQEVVMPRQTYDDTCFAVPALASHRTVCACWPAHLRPAQAAHAAPPPAGLRLDEIVTHLRAKVLYGEVSLLDKECSHMIIASQR